MSVDRRTFLKAAAAAAAAPLLPGCASAPDASAGPVTLSAGVGRQALAEAQPPIDVWGYDAAVPGPVLRFRQGERARIVAKNALPEATTVHWHGVRVPNAMDGVPHLTQKPIAVGGEFVYEFDLPDAGTYWYHPHQAGYLQVARGLYGAFVVEERAPIEVDQDAVWVLSDWRINPDGTQREDWATFRDLTHGGRIGNVITVNGRKLGEGEGLSVRAGERVRLRLVNAATARIFVLSFAGHSPTVIAYDGQPVAPHAPEKGRIVLAPSERVDVLIDCMAAPGSRHPVVESFYARFSGNIGYLAYRDEAPLRKEPSRAPIALPANPVPEVNLAKAERHEIVFEGGAMGSLREGIVEGKKIPIRQMVQDYGLAWTVNAVAAIEEDHHHTPLLTLKRNGHYLLAMRNDTSWHHPIHLHGHAFRVVARDGKPTPHQEWRDTVLMNPNESVDIAFVADNPGDWMFHCHVLLHQAGGMMATVRVA
ncbi:MAG: multicopper oxidase family protein [Pseudomonadota bacterium]